MDKTKKNIPWVEKYRPAKLSDVVFQTQAVATMEQIVQTFNVSSQTAPLFQLHINSDAAYDISWATRHR